eukprot:TRINITY_DN9608_c0_g2_i1.p1 TRINITY_DN9608_c0_g2~~TRINITY_DN9608_c0_g2_i1.p1  ORF type:complete len:205 (-),score=15.18 TRINITY_DN9608_c0_g2_i1:164-778(-)
MLDSQERCQRDQSHSPLKAMKRIVGCVVILMCCVLVIIIVCMVSLQSFSMSAQVSPDCSKPFRVWYVVVGLTKLAESLCILVFMGELVKSCVDEGIAQANSNIEDASEHRTKDEVAVRDRYGVRLVTFNCSFGLLFFVALFEFVWWWVGFILMLLPGCPLESSPDHFGSLVAGSCASTIISLIVQSCGDKRNDSGNSGNSYTAM